MYIIKPMLTNHLSFQAILIFTPLASIQQPIRSCSYDFANYARNFLKHSRYHVCENWELLHFASIIPK
jgi:hypothetical protein